MRPATTTLPLEIQLLDTNNAIKYSQFMILPTSTPIMSATEYGSKSSSALIVTPRSGYTYEKATMSNTSVPGGAYIKDSANKAVVAIANDGNIYINPSHPKFASISITYTSPLD